MSQPLASRDRLIDAAARVYAAVGFRGATTRRIAEEAGVNEVTIFRLFGSKAALIEEALRKSTTVEPAPAGTLPAEPVDPQAELTAWCDAHLQVLRMRRPVIRQAMGEAAENPEMGPCVSYGSHEAAADLKRYMKRLCELGFTETRLDEDGDAAEAHAAGAMLMAAIFGDAMGRDFMPHMYPRPASRAASLYVRLFLRAIRCPPHDWHRRVTPGRDPSRRAHADVAAGRPDHRGRG